jgi:membrane-bound ClpP family serine protease
MNLKHPFKIDWRGWFRLGIFMSIWFVVISTFLLVSSHGYAQNKTVTLQIKGGISPSLIPKVKDALALATGDPIPAGLIVLLEGPGGDGLAAMEIGRLLRAGHAHVFVTGKCSSACTIILMGGVVREAKDYQIGIHQARLTKIDKETGKRVEVEAYKNPKLLDRLIDANQQMKDYSIEMGLSEEFYKAMSQTPVDQMKWLTRGEAIRLGLIGIDPEYEKIREKYLIDRLKISPGDMKKKTADILDRCQDALTHSISNFVACYRMGLGSFGY